MRAWLRKGGGASTQPKGPPQFPKYVYPMGIGEADEIDKTTVNNLYRQGSDVAAAFLNHLMKVDHSDWAWALMEACEALDKNIAANWCYNRYVMLKGGEVIKDA